MAGDHWIHLRLPDKVPNGIGEYLARSLEWADHVPEEAQERWEADLAGRLGVLVGMPIVEAQERAHGIVRQWMDDVLDGETA